MELFLISLTFSKTTAYTMSYGANALCSMPVCFTAFAGSYCAYWATVGWPGWVGLCSIVVFFLLFAALWQSLLTFSIIQWIRISDFWLLDPDGDPDHHQNLITWSLVRALSLQEILSKSVHNFFSYPDGQTDRQTDRSENITFFAGGDNQLRLYSTVT